jgi:uncharacterized protein (DUF1697 family)
MPAYVALLRGVNVGGKGLLAMSDLRALCEKAGFTGVRTYIQSGNVVFGSRLGEAGVKGALERALALKMGRPVRAMVRRGDEIESVLARNPFQSAPGNRVLVLFLDEAPPKNALAGLEIPGREQVKLDGRELFVHYPDGMGRSRLKLKLAEQGTGRNINTVARLAALVSPARGSAGG